MKFRVIFPRNRVLMYSLDVIHTPPSQRQLINPGTFCGDGRSVVAIETVSGDGRLV